MRVIANHAGPIKEIEKNFGKPEFNLRSPKEVREISPDVEITDSIQSSSQTPQTSVEKESCDEELEEIQNALADAPFMQSSTESESLPPVELPAENNFSPGVARTILERLRSLGIPPTTSVRSLVAQTKESQLERNISALEEESAIKGLKSPIAAFKYFVSNNCKASNDRASWWNRAAVALGKQQRDRLIQAVFEYAGEVVVMFTNGQRLPLAQAQVMSWEALAALGEKP